MQASGRQRKEVFITGPNPEVLRFHLGPCLSGDFSGDWSEQREKKGFRIWPLGNCVTWEAYKEFASS